MARPLRLEFENALYHVTSRGNRLENIYDSDYDRTKFLTLLGKTCVRHNWICHAYCLMNNHYHLLIQTPDGNLSKGMRHLNGVYTQHFNRHHNCVGHLFQGRYKAIVVDADAYLLELARYIVLNPVRARMVTGPENWIWSSYRDTAGTRKPPAWLATHRLLSLFGECHRSCIQAYKRFVAEGIADPGPWSALKDQVVLGDKSFLKSVRNKSDRKPNAHEIPRYERQSITLSLAEHEEIASSRKDAVRAAYRSGVYTMRQIGEHFGMHYSTVSRIVNS